MPLAKLLRNKVDILHINFEIFCYVISLLLKK